jgi:hypothetical protein
MPRKYTRKNKRKGGGDEPIPPQASSKAWYDFSDSVPAMPDLAMPDLGLSSYNPFAAKKEENQVAYPTQGGKKKRKRRRMRGGSYSPNSSSYGADASPYSGPPTARAQAWVGGRKATRKRRGSRRR